MRAVLGCFSDQRRLWGVGIVCLLLLVVMAPLVFALPLIEKQIIDGVLLARRLDRLAPMVALYCGVWLAIAFLQIAGATLRAYFGERLSLHLRQRLFVHCEALAAAFARREHTGRTMALFANDAPLLTGFLSTTVVVGFGNVLAILLGAIVMFHVNAPLALVVLAAPPVVAGAAAVLTRPLRWVSRLVQDKAAELSERLEENLAGMREIIAFAQEGRQAQRFLASLTELLRLRMRLTFIDTTISVGQSVLSLAITLVIFGYGGYLVIGGRASLGSLVAMQALFSQVYQPALGLVGIVSGFQRVLASADRISEFLEQQPQVRERAGAQAPARIAGAITFDRVSFAYEAGRPVLDKVSFAASPGEMIALVGPSGAGKSTLANLVARFYDPAAGRVLLDGIDLRDLPLAWLRSNIAIVFQDTFLFSGTIRENIAFGRVAASDAAIAGAARAAHAWEFIERFPEGLATPVGQRGATLSEGQRQRLAIARALLREAPILILDEPTSALDARSESLLQSALDNLMRGRTTFVIAHRLATVQRADRILVVDNGRIVEQGTHTELLRRRGLYHELHALQFERPTPADDGPSPLLDPAAAGIGR